MPGCTLPPYLALYIFVCALPSALSASSPPEFAVVVKSTGEFRAYSTYTPAGTGRYQVQDGLLTATVSNVASNQWALSVRAGQDLSEVWFPWQTSRSPLDSNISDDIYYYPILLGVSEKATARNTDWAWYGGLYPGNLSAPFIIMADSQSAKIVAAVNWPPRAVMPMYAAQRMVLEYNQQPLLANMTGVYNALIATVKGNAASGNPPWMLAADLYKTWLNAHAAAPQSPAWMQTAHGFMNVQLQDYGYMWSEILQTWQSRQSSFPWMLFWGQMNRYAVNASCCLLNTAMDPVYSDTVPPFVRSNVAAGYHVGFYSSPYYGTSPSDPPRTLDTTAGVQWLTNWLNVNTGFGANSYYIDTIGRQYYGSPATVMNLFTNGTIPANSLIEGAVDVFPAANLVSGALVGDTVYCGAPQKTPENSIRTTFPRLMRYVLGSRTMFLGESNTDWRFWNADSGWANTLDKEQINVPCGYVRYCQLNGPCEHGTERAAFLLGAKLDIKSPFDKNLGGGELQNPVVDAIVGERNRVHWWSRNPEYRDTRGLTLTSIPAGSAIEVTRFLASDGHTLLAVSNPNLVAGVSVLVDGKTVSVPLQAIAVIDLN